MRTGQWVALAAWLSLVALGWVMVLHGPTWEMGVALVWWLLIGLFAVNSSGYKKRIP